MFKRVPLVWLCMAAATADLCADTRRFAIDPDPNSPTLGEILDRQNPPKPTASRAAPKRAAPVAPAPVPNEPAMPVDQSQDDAAPAPIAHRTSPSLPAPKSTPATTVLLPNAARPAPRRIPLTPTEAPSREAGLPKRAIEAPALPQEPARAIAPLPETRTEAPSLSPVQVRSVGQTTLPQPVGAIPVATRPVRRVFPVEAPILTGSTQQERSERAPGFSPAPIKRASEAAKPPVPIEERPPVALPTMLNPAGPNVPVPQADPNAFVFVFDQDLRAFLTDFSRRVGLRADIGSTVRGRLTKVKLPAEPTALLKELEKRHEIEWVIEGELLKVSSRADLATRILPLGQLTQEDLIRELRTADIDLSRYPLQKLGGSNALMITAPAAHIARISAIIDALKAGKSAAPNLRIIRAGNSAQGITE